MYVTFPCTSPRTMWLRATEVELATKPGPSIDGAHRFSQSCSVKFPWAAGVNYGLARKSLTVAASMRRRRLLFPGNRCPPHGHGPAAADSSAPRAHRPSIAPLGPVADRGARATTGPSGPATAPTSISSATCTSGRTVFSTRAAASQHYSGVYLFRFAITTTLSEVSMTRHLVNNRRLSQNRLSGCATRIVASMPKFARRLREG